MIAGRRAGYNMCTRPFSRGYVSTKNRHNPPPKVSAPKFPAAEPSFGKDLHYRRVRSLLRPYTRVITLLGSWWLGAVISFLPRIISGSLSFWVCHRSKPGVALSPDFGIFMIFSISPCICFLFCSCGDDHPGPKKMHVRGLALLSRTLFLPGVFFV